MSSGRGGEDVSQGDTSYARPASPPTASTIVPSSWSKATRFTAGSRMKTIVPAGASTLLAVDRELRAAAEHDVHLLVPAGPAAELVVVLDDVLADALARVDVGAERPDPELPPQRVPHDARYCDRVEVVEVNGLPAARIRHRLLSSSSTTGSIALDAARRAPPGSRCRPSCRTRCGAGRRSRVGEPVAQLRGEVASTLDPLVRGRLAEQHWCLVVDAPQLRERRGVIVDAQVDDGVGQARVAAAALDHEQRRRLLAAAVAAAACAASRASSRRSASGAPADDMNVSASASTVAPETRMLPWAAKHGPVVPPAQCMQSAPV